MSLVLVPGDALATLTLLFMLMCLRHNNLKSLLIVLLISDGLSAYLKKLVGILPSITCLIAMAILLYYAGGIIEAKNAIRLLSISIIFFMVGFLITYFFFMTLKMALTGHFSPGCGRDPGAISWTDWLSAFSLQIGSKVNSHLVTYSNEAALLWSRMA